MPIDFSEREAPRAENTFSDDWLPGGAVSVEVYVRAYTPRSHDRRLGEILARLRALSDRDRIADLDVRTWPRRIWLDADDAVTDAFVAFEEWANRAGVSVRPPFSVIRPGRPSHGDAAPVVILPEMVLAVYENDSLVGVYPHETDSGTVTVSDAIDRLSGRNQERRPISASVDPARGTQEIILQGPEHRSCHRH